MHKFNDAQLKYTVTGQELLVAYEACQQFDQIIRGCKIRIHTDHQNLTHDGTVHVNLREQRTQILLDVEYGAPFVHIKGVDNTAADGLSHLEMTEGEPTEMHDLFAISMLNNLDKEDSDNFPLDMKFLMVAQKSNDKLQQCISSGKLRDRLGT